MRSCFSSTCSGRISARPISPGRWLNTPGGSGALAPAPADLLPIDAPKPPGLRWADLQNRVASALVLGGVLISCLWIGGWPFSLVVWLCAVGLWIEWHVLCRNR